MKLIKTAYLIAFFIIPAYLLTTNGHPVLGGMYLGAFSILLLLEKSKKAREFVKKIF